MILEDSITYLASKGLKHATSNISSRARHLANFHAAHDKSVDRSTAHRFGGSRLNEYDVESLPKLYVWSFHDDDAMSRQAPELIRYFREIQTTLEDKRSDYLKATPFLSQLSYTLSERRTLLPRRSFCVASSIDELCEKVDSKMSKPINSTRVPRVAFLFTGQGAQLHAMGRELVRYQVYGRSLLDADAYLKTLGCKWSVYGKKENERNESLMQWMTFHRRASA